MAKRDYYDILGVAKDATEDDIKKSYRKLAKQYHPDVNKASDAEEKFKEIQEAYEVLSDSQKREQYNHFGHEGPNTGGFGGFDFGGFGGFEDIFSSIFGGERRTTRSQSTKGRSLKTSVTLSFEEAVFGVEKEITVTKNDTCHDCSGTGAQSKSDVETCSNCHGTGKVYTEQMSFMGRIRTESTCSVCRGEGKTIKNKCNTCKGEGRIRNTSKLKFKIPSGIEDGQTITLAGKGEGGVNGGLAGDLYISINVLEHEYFIRDNLDIYIEMPVTFSQVALGGSIEIPTINGKSILKIPAGTQTNTKFKLGGKGITNGRTGVTGHQYVVVNVVTPEKLTNEQKDLFNKLSKTNEESSSIFKRIKRFFSTSK